MRVEKNIKYKKKLSLLNTFQYLIAAIITISFGIGLIPGQYGKIYIIIISAIVIQIIISIIRMRLLNVILELILLLLSIISIIPILGYIFRIIGLISGILEMASFKNYNIYKQVEIRTFKKNPNKTKKNQKKISEKTIKDADFIEK